MKFQNLSVKRLFGRVAMGLVLSMSGITIALFFVTKQAAALLTGGALLLCALVGIFVLTQAYALLLDRAHLSQLNGWTDEAGRVYLIFPVEKIAAVLHRSLSSAKNALAELSVAGLIERKRRGQ